LQAKQIRQYLEFLKLSGVQDIFLSANSPSADRAELAAHQLRTLAQKYSSCQDCALAAGRDKLVYGAGNPIAKLMVISEGPGREENISGQPFVGAAGKLLSKMLAAIQLERSEIYITNVVKCRPPQNRDPHPEEISACSHILAEQMEIIQPRLLLVLGKVAAESLLKQGLSLGAYRQQDNYFRGIRTFVSYHPAALLRHSAWKKPAWVDLQKLQKEYKKLK
jgi:DNA polymerase